MDFGEMLRVLARRWRVTAPGLILAAILTTAMWVVSPTTYQSVAVLTLISSQSISSSPGGGHNPYVSVSALFPLASILATNLSSEQAAQQLKALGVEQAYTAQVPAGAAGPFIALTVTGKDRPAIVRSMPMVIKFAEQELKQLQLEASATMQKKSFVGATVIAEPSAPAPVLKSKIERVASVGIIGLVVLFLLCFSAEGRARRRENDRRRQARDDAASHKHRQPGRGDFPEKIWESAQTH
jgi:hypothetical protein